MNQASQDHWHCLRSQPKHEHVAALQLRKQFELPTFAPRIRYRRLRQQRQVWTTEALFPGYLFARFNAAEHWRAVQSSHAVRNILRFGREFAVIEPAIIEQLRELVGPEAIVVVPPVPPVPGQEIVVAEGPFRGLRSIITSYLPAKERIKVLLRLMGQEREVELPVATVSPLRTGHPLKTRFGAAERRA